VPTSARQRLTADSVDSPSPNVTTPEAPGRAGSLFGFYGGSDLLRGPLTEQSGRCGRRVLEPGAVAMFGIGVVFAGPAHGLRRWFD